MYVAPSAFSLLTTLYLLREDIPDFFAVFRATLLNNESNVLRVSPQDLNGKGKRRGPGPGWGGIPGQRGQHTYFSGGFGLRSCLAGRRIRPSVSSMRSRNAGLARGRPVRSWRRNRSASSACRASVEAKTRQATAWENVRDLLRHAPLDIGLPEVRSNFISKAGVRKKSHIKARPITMPHIRPISELIR